MPSSPSPSAPDPAVEIHASAASDHSCDALVLRASSALASVLVPREVPASGDGASGAPWSAEDLYLSRLRSYIPSATSGTVLSLPFGRDGRTVLDPRDCAQHGWSVEPRRNSAARRSVRPPLLRCVSCRACFALPPPPDAADLAVALSTALRARLVDGHRPACSWRVLPYEPDVCRDFCPTAVAVRSDAEGLERLFTDGGGGAPDVAPPEPAGGLSAGTVLAACGWSAPEEEEGAAGPRCRPTPFFRVRCRTCGADALVPRRGADAVGPSGGRRGRKRRKTAEGRAEAELLSQPMDPLGAHRFFCPLLSIPEDGEKGKEGWRTALRAALRAAAISKSPLHGTKDSAEAGFAMLKGERETGRGSLEKVRAIWAAAGV